MADADRITENAKRAIVEILDRVIQVEYMFVMNYPRIIDQIVSIEGIIDEQLAADLEHLGQASTVHLGIITRLTTRLGGEPDFRLNTIDRLVDLDSMGEQQVAGEKAAIRLYTEAKRLAEDNPVKSTGFGAILRSRSGAKPDAASRGETIRLLEHLANEEVTHLRIVEDCLATYREMSKRRD